MCDGKIRPALKVFWKNVSSLARPIPSHGCCLWVMKVVATLILAEVGYRAMDAALG